MLLKNQLKRAKALPLKMFMDVAQWFAEEAPTRHTLSAYLPFILDFIFIF